MEDKGKKNNKKIKKVITTIVVVLALLICVRIALFVITNPDIFVEPKEACALLDGGTRIYDYGSYRVVKYKTGNKRGHKIVFNNKTIYDAHPELNYPDTCG